jgi:hypothetical protein
MAGRHLAIGLAAITAILVLASRANAEVLALDCSGAGTKESIWVDIDKSVVTEKNPNGSISTEPVTVTATSISWKSVDACCTWTREIDRTSGDYHYTGIADQNGLNGQHFPGAHLQCTKGSAPFPATKF